jgi:hypothetical protein
MNLTNAREHLDRAQKQFNSAATDSWEPPEPESCVSSVFYAYENVMVALAEDYCLRLTSFLFHDPNWKTRLKHSDTHT